MKLWKKLTAAVLMSAAMLGAGLTAKPESNVSGGVTANAAAGSITLSDDGVLTLHGELTKEQIWAYRENESVTSVVAANGTILPADCSNLFRNGFQNELYDEYGCEYYTTQYYWKNVTSVDLSRADKSKITKATGMFCALTCYLDDTDIIYSSYRSINLGGIDFSSVPSTYCLCYGCNRLTNLILPDGITEIDSWTFGCCSSLTSFTIPDTVTSIHSGAFDGSDSLTSITIPDSVTSIESNVFSNTPWLRAKQNENPLVIVNHILIDGTTVNGDIVIPDSVTSIVSCAFSNCVGLTSITIPDSVTSIGSYAFSDCTGLTSITIPDSVPSIGTSTFESCYSLTSITIPDSVTSIGYSAFERCFGLTSITIPDSVTTIDDWAFYGCTGLTSITIPDSVTSIGYRAFERCTGLTSITIPDSVTSIGYYAFNGCARLTIRGIPGSYAEQYANKNSIPFESVYTVPITSVTLLQTEFAYTGKAVKIGSYIRVKSNGTALKYGTDFTMTYANNVKCGVGTASVTIKGIGDYSGSFTKYYSILPEQQDKPVLSTWNGRLGKLRVTWQADANARGYEVQYCRDASFTGDTLHSHYFATATTCLLVTYPKPGEKWYVRVRSYLKDNAGERFGFYSDAASITLGKIDNVNLTQTEFAYTGEAVKVGSCIRVKSGTTALKYGTDFELIYKNNVDKGTASVTVKGIGEYAGSSVTKTYQIK